MTQRNKPARPLTELQQAILDFIWRDGPATAEQVRAALSPRHELKDSSVRTLLRRLEAQGHLSHRADGKQFLYQAAASSSSLAARTVRQLIERFWSGSAEEFLAGMVDEKVLSIEQMEQLAKKVKEAK